MRELVRRTEAVVGECAGDEIGSTGFVGVSGGAFAVIAEIGRGAGGDGGR